MARSPIRWVVRMMRRAISPRLATRTDSNTGDPAFSTTWATPRRQCRGSGDRQARITGVILVLVVAVLAVAVAVAVGGDRLVGLRVRAVRLLVIAAALQLMT